jgi:cytoskeletal protein RodZ
MIGFIGSLFVGIFGILGKLLPGKKKDYLIDFDDAVSTVQEKTQDAVSAVQEKAQDVASAVQEKTEDATEQLASTKEAVASKQSKAKKRPTQKSEKKAKAPVAKTQAPKPAAPAPAPAVNGKVAPKAAEPVVLFAPNYLLPKPTATRRRPGANMSMFVQMSREMNIRR